MVSSESYSEKRTVLFSFFSFSFGRHYYLWLEGPFFIDGTAAERESLKRMQYPPAIYDDDGFCVCTFRLCTRLHYD